MSYLSRCAFLLLGTITLAFAQTPEVDSLSNVFQDEQTVDSVRFEAGYSLLMRRFRSNLDSARQTGRDLLAFSIEAQNRKWEATSHRLIGNTFAVQGRFQEANEAFFKSHNILLELNDKEGLSTTFNNIGTVFYELGNYTQSQEYLLQALKLAEEREDDVAASRALNNLGNVHTDLKNNEEALDYYQRSLSLREKLGDRRRLPAAYNNIGLIFSNLGERQKAIDNLNKSAAIAEELGDLRSMTRAFNNLGIEYTKLRDYDEALDFFGRSIQIKTDIDDLDGLASAYLYRGQAYLEMGRYERARQDCAQSLELTQASGALNWEKEGCLCMSQALEAAGSYRTALAYQQRFQTLNDSLFNKERTQDITRAEMNYQFEKQQLADSIAFHKLQTEQQVAYERALNGEQRKFYTMLIISLLVIAFMGFLYWRYQQNLKVKKLENDLLNSEIEFKKKDLTNLAVNISSNLEWAESLVDKVTAMKESTGRQRARELEDLESAIKNKVWVDKEGDEFYKQIDELSSSFYHKLNTEFDGLTKTEIRLCSLIRLDLNTKQIAVLQNIEPSSVKMSRNRLRKKLNLAPEDDLTAFLHAL